MREWPPGAAILLDGPLAGHLAAVPEDCWSWVVRPPQPITIGLLTNPDTLTDTTVFYSIRVVYYGPARQGNGVRVGWCTPGDPQPEALYEYVPTGLAELGRLPWDLVPPTERDHAEPVQIEGHGNPLKTCGIKLSDPNWLPADWMEASCACGWRTQRVAVDRRSQLVRAASRHTADEAGRRARFHEPIRVIAEGSGAQPDCYGGIATDRRAERVFGRCRRCGWQTEAVEYFRTGLLRVLCQAHTGPDGVRRVRDQLLAAYGLPVPGDEQPALARDVHSDGLCADSHGSDPPSRRRCLDGTVYGECGHENCYGACEDTGRCHCTCHGEEAGVDG